MTRALLVCLLLAACSKPRHLPECDALRGTIDRLARCPSLPAAAKDAIAKANQQVGEVFDLLDRAGGIDKAPKELSDSILETCKAQDAALTDAYRAVAPDCLK